ncbi:MAG: AraC family transcriptional regulator [Cyanobacteria bacterium J06588_4]
MHLLRHYCLKEHQFESTNSGLPPHKLKQALQYIHQNLDGNIKINDIAMRLGISQYYFCRLFRESTGIAPYRYVIQQRVSKAKQLIEENELSLLAVAIECGFSSQSQMTHHFRRLVGITPKAYRNKL